METLMIHDIHPNYFDLNLNSYRLTFDDGLFSQYYYFPLLKHHPEKLIYFITTSFIRPGPARDMFSGEYLPYIKSKKYMYRTFIEKKFDHFMTVEELQSISRQNNVQIGIHSHFHDVIFTRTHPRKRKPVSKWKLKRFEGLSDISTADWSIRSKLAFQGFKLQDGKLRRRSEAEWEDYIKYDTELAVRWAADHLGLCPDSYCFAFNEHNQTLISILKTFGFKKFFSARPGEFTEILGRVDIDSLVVI
jgi:hypothetical protein